MANKQKIVLLLEGDANGAIKATVDTGKGLDKVTEKGKKTSKQLRDIADKGVKWGAVAAGAAAAGAAVLVKQQLDLIDNTAKTSDKLGIATEKLTAMRVQAELTGVGANTLDMGLQRMVRRLAEAAEGTGEAKGALAELNLDAKALANLSPDKQFGAIADAMENVGSQSDKVRLAFKLFDSEGVALVNTLKGGSAAALEAEKFTEQWGLAVSRIDASKIEQANDAMSMLTQASGGFWTQLTVNVSPAITGMAKEILGVGEGFGTAEELADKAFKAIITGAGFVGDMGRGLEIIWKGATMVVAEWFASVWEAIAGADRLITDLLNKLPTSMGGGTFETSDFLQNVSGALRNTATELGEDLTDLLERPLASTAWPQKIKEWEDAATAAGEKVARAADLAIAANTNLESGVRELTEEEKKLLAEREKQAALNADLLGDTEYQVGLLSRELTATYAGADALAAFNREKVIEAALRNESAQNLLPAERAQYTAMIGAQYDLAIALEKKTEADKAAAEAAKESAGAMDKFLNASFGDGLADGFNQGSKALASFIDGFGELLDVQAQYNAAQLDAAATDADKANAAAKYQSAQVGLYGDMAAASKQFFDEGSKGYKALQAAEQTFRAFEIGMAAKSLAAKLFATETATTAALASVAPTVAAEGAKATAAGTASAASSMVGTPFPANLGALAATLAALAGIGVLISGSGGGGLSTAQQAQQSQGTGTVLGDSSAKSDSAFKALELMEDHLSDGLQVSNGMLAELRNLNTNISGLGNLLGRKLSLGGGLVDVATGSSIGTAGGYTNDAIMSTVDLFTLGFADELDKLLGGALSGVGGAVSSKSSSKIDEGLQILGGSVADILASGTVDAMAFAVIQTKKRKLGSGTKSSNSRVEEALGAEIAGQFGQVISSIYESAFAALDLLGIGDTSKLKTFEGLSVSTYGLSAEDAQKEIESVVSAFADSVALTVVPSLLDFQKVGEGLFETLTRVATQTVIFKDAAAVLGLSLSSEKSVVENFFASVGNSVFGLIDRVRGRDRDRTITQTATRAWTDEEILKIADDLTNAAGGLEQFAGNISSFTDLVLSDSEKFGQAQGYVAAMFERLGAAVPASTKELKAYVAGLDLSKLAHQEAFTAITSASDLLDDYYSKLEDYTKSAYDFDTAFGVNDGSKALRDALAAVGQNFDVVETAAMGGVSALAELFSGLTDVEKAGLEPFTDSILNLIPATADASSGLAEMQRQMERLGGIAKSIRQYLDGLNYSGVTGTPEQQVQAAFAELQNLSVAAYGGDADAAQRLTGLADQVLRLGDTAYASGEQFQSLFSSVKNMLATVADNTDFQTVEEMQFGLMQNQLDALSGIIQGITDQTIGQASLLNAINGGIVDLGGSLTAELTTTSKSEIEKLVKFVTNTDGFPAELQDLALTSASTLFKTINYFAGSALPDDLKYLALAAASTYTKTANYVVGAELPSDLKALALAESSEFTRTVNAAISAGASLDAISLALSSGNAIATTVNALFAAGYDQAAADVALINSNAITTTVNTLLAAGYDQSAFDLAFAESSVLSRYINTALAQGYSQTAYDLAFMQASSISKIVDVAFANGHNSQAVDLAFKTSDTMLKSVNVALAAGYDQSAIDLAYVADSLMTKSVSASLAAGRDQTAIDLAYKIGDTITKTVSAALASGYSQKAYDLAYKQGDTISKLVTASLKSGYSQAAVDLAYLQDSTATKFIDVALAAGYDDQAVDIAYLGSSSLIKSVDVALAQGYSQAAYDLAYLSSSSMTKYVSAALAAGRDQAAIDLANQANSSITKTVSAALAGGYNQQALDLAFAAGSNISVAVNSLKASGYVQEAANLAFASSSTIQKAIQATGGALSADQKAILDALNGSASVSLSGDVLLEADDEIRKGLFWWNTQNLVTKTLAGILGVTADSLVYQREIAKAVVAERYGISYTDGNYNGLVNDFHKRTSRMLSAFSGLLGISNADDYSITTNTANAFKGLPAFASGGDHLGGLRIVGENGPELEATGPSRIFSARDTAAMLGGGKVDMTPVVNAIDGHRQETAHQTKIQAAAQKQLIDQLRALNNRVSSLESEQKTARLVNS